MSLNDQNIFRSVSLLEVGLNASRDFSLVSLLKLVWMLAMIFHQCLTQYLCSKLLWMLAKILHQCLWHMVFRCRVVENWKETGPQLCCKVKESAWYKIKPRLYVCVFLLVTRTSTFPYLYRSGLNLIVSLCLMEFSPVQIILANKWSKKCIALPYNEFDRRENVVVPFLTVKRSLASPLLPPAHLYRSPVFLAFYNSWW